MGFLGGIANAIAVAVLYQFLLAGLLITTAAATIAGTILGLAIDPSFIRIPYTTGPIIDTGWGVVRDFANMLIVFFLIIIGLATALRLGQYEAKKTLPKLIGVALLINFTPVITGFIVDISNVFMNFFLEGLAGIGLITSLFTNLTSVVAGNLTDPSLIFKLVALMAFQVVAAIVFLLFAALFMVRHIAIWILVILSPIAFVASILPRTSGLFKMWWNQFFQWSIIGVFAAFFLWLGDHIISIAAQGKLVAPAPSGGGISGSFIGMLNDIMPFGIALAMLLVGFFVALQSSAMGSAATKAFAMKGVKWGGLTAGTAAWRKFGGAAAVPGSMLTGLGSRLQQWGKQKQAAGGVMALAGGVAGVVAGWGIRRSGEVLNAAPKELTKQVHFRDTEAFNNAVKETAKMGDSQDVFHTINAERLKPVPNKNRILGLLTGVRNRGDADDIEAALKPGGALAGKESMIGDLIKLGRDRIGPNGERPLFKAFYGQIMTNPARWGFNIKDADLKRDAEGNAVKDDAERVAFEDIEKDAAGKAVLDKDRKPKLKKKTADVVYLEGAMSKIPARMATEDFRSDEITPSNYNPEDPVGRAFLLSMLKERGAELIGQIIRRREGERRQAIIDYINSVSPEWMKEHAPDVLKWFASTGAGNLGVSMESPDPGRHGQRITISEAAQMVAPYEMRKIGDTIAKIQENISKLRTLQPGTTNLSQESLQKIRELQEEETRRRGRLERLQSSYPGMEPAPARKKESSARSSEEGFTGGTGPTRGPRPDRPT